MWHSAVPTRLQSLAPAHARTPLAHSTAITPLAQSAPPRQHRKYPLCCTPAPLYLIHPLSRAKPAAPLATEAAMSTPSAGCTSTGQSLKKTSAMAVVLL